MSGKIFISYRRSETSWAARALFERLWREFGDRVFIDIEGLTLGTDYTKVIDEHLDGCEVMLALIGVTWLDEIRRREADEGDEEAEPDWVRAELSRALSRGIPVVPVLIEDATLPLKRELPVELKALRNKHGLELHAKLFDAQVAPLVREIGKVLTVSELLAPVAPVRPMSVAVTALPSPTTAPTVVSNQSLWREGQDQYGRWREIQVENVVQRLRWVEPGSFLMGRSPEDFAESDIYEVPQHSVHISRGYWLADTVCTVDFWRAVLGGEEAKHRLIGENMPIVNITWNDISDIFLPRLKEMLGVNVFLPSEAEWEYACRAGSVTAYSFGDQPDFGKINCQSDGLRPVRYGAINSWGIYQMHGNVLEWCRNSRYRYSAGPAIDPEGVLGKKQRALRGGSWVMKAAKARSAARATYACDHKGGTCGFRFICIFPE